MPPLGLQVYLRPRVTVARRPPDLQRGPFHAVASRTTCANLHQNRFIRFQWRIWRRLCDRPHLV